MDWRVIRNALWLMLIGLVWAVGVTITLGFYVGLLVWAFNLGWDIGWW